MDTPQLSGSYEALFEQVEYLLKAGERDEAQRILERLHKRLNGLSEKVLARRPELEDLRVVVNSVLASVYREQSRFDDAVELYEQLIASTPETEHTDWKHALATLMLDKGEINAGLDALRELTIAHPNDLTLWLSLGSALIHQKLYDEAETAMKHAITLKTDNDEDLLAAYTLLFLVYKQTKNYDAAEKIWERRWQISKDEEKETMPLYEMFFGAGDFEKVEYWLEKEKDTLIAGFYRAQLAQRRGDENAVKLWKKVAAQNPNQFGRGWDMCAEAQLRSGEDPQKVLETILESVSLQRVSMRGVLLMAVAQLLLGNTEAVHDTLQRYVKGLQEDGIAENARIPYEHWQLFSELAAENPGVAEFEPYFETTLPENDD